MTDDDKRTLHPATIAELEDSLSFALRHAGRKRVHTAERLVRHLEQSGYVLMKRPGAVAPSISGHKHPHEA